jgi:hypothetical protein
MLLIVGCCNWHVNVEFFKSKEVNIVVNILDELGDKFPGVNPVGSLDEVNQRFADLNLSNLNYLYDT